MKKELLYLADVTIRNGQFEKVRSISLMMRQTENTMLWGRDHTGRILIRFLRGEGTALEGSVYAGGGRLQEYTRDAFEKHRIYYIDSNAEFMNSLDLAENLFLLKKNSLRKFWLNTKAIHSQAQMLLEKYGTGLNGREKIRSLGTAGRIAAALVRAAAQGAQLIALDNITADCPAEEIRFLCGIIGKMQREDITFLIYDVHGESLLPVVDRMIVMKQGVIVKKLTDKSQFGLRYQAAAGQTMREEGQIIREKGGEGERVIKEKPVKERSVKDGDYRIRGIVRDEKRPLDIRIAPGEIVFLPHRDAAAQLKCWRTLLGEEGCRPEINLCEKTVKWKNCADLIRSRIAFWGKERGGSCLFYKMSVEDNILMPSLKRISRFGFYRREADFIMQDGLIEAGKLLRIRPEYLSQKAELELNVYRWKLFHPRILILYNILSGLDEELKEWTAGQLRLMAERGSAVLLLEMSAEDAMALADRIIGNADEADRAADRQMGNGD